jgi:hypothetical protein
MVMYEILRILVVVTSLHSVIAGISTFFDHLCRKRKTLERFYDQSIHRSQTQNAPTYGAST